MQLRVPLPYVIDKDMADELAKESVYVSRHIHSFTVDEDGKAATVEVAEQADHDATIAVVERYVAAMLDDYRGEEETVAIRRVRRGDQGPVHEDVYAELQRREWLFELGPGHVALAGPALRLTQFIDQYAARRYRDEYAAEERAFPAMVSADVLARCGYLESHPNLVTWVTHLTEDFDLIERFRQDNLGLTGCPPDPAAVQSPGLALNPAACLPSYATLAGQRVPAHGRTLSWPARVFRYESKNLTTLERLWEFTVRELVYVADPSQLAPWRDQLVDLVCDMATAFDLDMAIEVATDPFFATVAAAKRFWQQSMESKYEIRLTVGHDEEGNPRTVAAGSVNLHGTFFGERFGISTPEAASAGTACVGLGIERWALAVFAQHGFDPERWPTPMREHVFADAPSS